MANTLLILAGTEDCVASRLADHATRRGIRATHLSEVRDLGITLELDRTGRAAQQITIGHSHVTGILNRYCPPSDSRKTTMSFVRCEELGTVWAALGLFDGPVINRPTREGLFPQCHVLSVSRSVPYSVKAPSSYMMSRRSGQGDLQTEGASWTLVHNLMNGLYLGSWDEVRDRPDRPPVIVTEMHRSDLMHLLIVGHRVLDLAQVDGQLESESAEAVSALVGELRRREALFCAVVLQKPTAASRPEVLSVTPFPPLHWFMHVEEHAYDGLLEYLT